MKRKNLLFVLLALVFLASFAPAASAQAPGITMKVTAAFGGNFKYGEWLPLMAEIENKGADVEAELRVRVGGADMANVFVVPVSLPAGARKLVPVYVLPNNFSRVLDVRLVSGDTLLASQQVTVRPQANIAYFVGLISAQRGALSLINGVTLPGTQERSKVLVDIPLEELPERVEGLSAFNTLVFNDVDTSKLTPKQAEALQGWVEAGGRLVIGGGAGAQKTFAGLPAGLQPVKLNGTQEIQADGLGELVKYAGDEKILTPGTFVAAKAALPSGVHVLAGTSDAPLVVESSAGKGSIDFIPLDLSAVPFEGWSGTQSFWKALLSPGAVYPEGMPVDMSARQMRSTQFYGALTNIPSLDLPSVRSLSILLGLFILLVGPVNYYVLRRTRRLHLAWITIPAITAIFAAGAFGLGFALRGNDLILNKISLIEVQNSGPAHVTSYVGLFSPRQQSYEIEVQSQSLISPSNPYYGPEGPMGAQREMSFVQGQPSVVKGLSVDQWAMQSFVVEDSWKDFGKISGSLTLQNETLKGTVTNDTAYTLKDATVVVNRRFQRLGDLGPGQTLNVDLGLSQLNRDVNGPPLSYKMYQEPYSQQGGRLPRDLMLKSQVVDNVFENAMYTKFGGVNMMNLTSSTSGAIQPAVLFGWIDQAPPAVGVRGQPASQVTTGLVYAQINITLPENGTLALPPGMIQGRIVELPRGMSTCGPSGTSVYLDNAEVEFEFQVPASLAKLKIDGLKVSVYHDNPQAAYKGMSIYDWQQKKWVSTSAWKSDPWTNPNGGGTGENVSIPSAGTYLNGDGMVRVKVTSGMGSPSCYYVDMGFQGQSAVGQGGGG